MPGHVHLRKLGDIAKEEIRRAGGIPFEFNTIGVDDEIAMGHAGMRYSLPSRELIADSAETMLNAHWFDGALFMPNCDKITPGMLMAAARTNIPSVFVSGGPMHAGVDPETGESATLSTMFEAVGVILVGSCPSGTSSSVMAFLAKGDVALDVSIEALSNLLAPVMATIDATNL